MKKICLMTLACVMLLSLVACGTNPTSSDSTTSTPTTTTSEACSTPTTTAASAAELFVKGTIVDASMNSLTIKTDDGTELMFGTVDADKTKCDGLIIDSKVTVFYTGKIVGKDTSKAMAVRVEQP